MRPIPNKSGMAQWLVIATIVSMLVALWTISGGVDISNLTASITGSGEYIERPIFYYDKCEQTSDLKYSATNTFSSQWLKKPSVTDEYKVTLSELSALKQTLTSGSRLTYAVCNSKDLSDSNCRIDEITIRPTSSTFTISSIKPNEYVFAKFEKSSFFSWSVKTAKYQIAYQPYGLRQYNVLSGSSNQINPNSCSYSSKQKDTILSENLGKVSQPSGTTSNQNTLQPNEIRWYVAGYLTSAKPSFMLRYSGRDAWCRTTGSSGEVYAINEIQTSGGSYKVASADWSDYLGSVTCCPSSTKGDAVCSDDFKWETIAGSECSAFNSCGSPNWVPYAPEKLIKYSCVSGSCEKEIKTVGCVSDFDCKDSNGVCDLNLHSCVNANVNLDGQVIKTIPDSEADCLKEGGHWISKETQDSSFLNFMGIGEPDIIVEEYCDLSSPTNWTFWIVLILSLGAVIVFFPAILGIIRALLSKIGVKI